MGKKRDENCIRKIPYLRTCINIKIVVEFHGAFNEIQYILHPNEETDRNFSNLVSGLAMSRLNLKKA